MTQNWLFERLRGPWGGAPQKGSGGGGTTTVQSNKPPEEVLAAYRAAFNQAQNVASQPYVPYSGATVAGFTPMQTAAFENINTAANAGVPFINAASQYGTQAGNLLSPENFGDTVSAYQNPFTDSVVRSAQDVFNLQNATQQAQLTGNAIAAGAWGGDRANIAKNDLTFKQALAQNSALSGLLNQGWQQSVGAAQNNAGLNLQTGALMAGFGSQAQQQGLAGANAQLGAGTLEQQLAQQQLNVPYQQFQAAQQYPFQTTGWLSNIATGLGSQMGGTSSTTQPGPSGLSQVVGLGSLALGAANLFGLKRGGTVAGFADGGVPDFSVSIVPETQIRPGSGAPKPPSPNPSKAAEDPMAGLSNIGALSRLLKPRGKKPDDMLSSLSAEPDTSVIPIPPQPPDQIPPIMDIIGLGDPGGYMRRGGVAGFAHGGVMRKIWNPEEYPRREPVEDIPRNVIPSWNRDPYYRESYARGGFADGGEAYGYGMDEDAPSVGYGSFDGQDPMPLGSVAFNEPVSGFSPPPMDTTPESDLGYDNQPLPEPPVPELVGAEPVAGFGDAAKADAGADNSVQAGLGALPARRSVREEGTGDWMERILASPSGALIAMGLGILGGTSPHAGVNIGRGALQGLSAYGTLRQQRDTAALRRIQEEDKRDYYRGRLGIGQQNADANTQKARVAEMRAQAALNRAANAGQGRMTAAEVNSRAADELVQTSPDLFPTKADALRYVTGVADRAAASAGRISQNQQRLGQRDRELDIRDRGVDARLELGRMANDTRVETNAIRRRAMELASDDRERAMISRANDNTLREAARAWSFAGGRKPFSDYLTQVQRGRASLPEPASRETPQSAPTPAPTPPSAAPAGNDRAAGALAAARAAIARGAPRDAVIQRLRAAGIDPSGL